MNYFEWSQEYYDTAENISHVIEKLRTKRKSTDNLSERKDLDMKITTYKMYYNECIFTANHLMQRHRGVA